MIELVAFVIWNTPPGIVRGFQRAENVCRCEPHLALWRWRGAHSLNRTKSPPPSSMAIPPEGGVYFQLPDRSEAGQLELLGGWRHRWEGRRGEGLTTPCGEGGKGKERSGGQSMPPPIWGVLGEKKCFVFSIFCYEKTGEKRNEFFSARKWQWINE